jgi:serine/threonine-protein kinase
MEYLPGENLAAIARTGNKSGKPLPIAFAVKIIAQACEGLGHAHGRMGVSGKHLDVVHRDVSPQNIIVTYDGQVKVVDFGIAKATNRGSQTLGGQIKGKISYMAPEQARGEPLDARADLFSLAVVLYELVTRSRLFHRDDQFQALNAVTSEEPVEPAQARNREVPAELSAVLAKALQRKAQDRYGDARALQTALEEWLKAQPSVNAGDLGAYMDGLFAPRIHARAQLIETASRGELTPSAARGVLKNDTDHSMPGRTGLRTAVSQAGSPRRLWSVLIPSAIALLISGVLLAKMLFKHDPVAPSLTPALQVAEVGTLAIETDPPGAELLLDGQGVGKSPQTLPGLSLAAHEVKARFPGRQEVSKSVKLSAAGERAMVVLVLPAVATAAPPEPSKPNVEPTPAKPKAPPVAATGKLSLNTQPWTRVSFNGKVLGDTPLIDAVLPAGRQTLKLQNEDKGLSLDIEVEIRAGQTTKKVLKL